MSLVLSGSTSGSVTLQEPAIAGTTVLTLPAVSGTIITTASSGQSIPKAALPTGSVLQVVQTQYSAQVASSSATFADSGVTASITPTSSSSNILVLATVNGLEKSNGNNNNSVTLRLVRDSTTLSTYMRYAGWMNAQTSLITPSAVINYLDSPATTSSTTYKIQFANEQAASQVFVQSSGSISFIVLMEIAA
jgi:hypothetical protein